MRISVVSPQEADFVLRHRNESGVGDRNAVRIAREVGQDLRRAGKRSVGIDDPLKDHAEYIDGEKELVSAGNPSIWC